jgi:hypothetical protein
MRHDSSLGQLCLQLLFDTIDMRARQHCLFHTTRQHDTSTYDTSSDSAHVRGRVV